MADQAYVRLSDSFAITVILLSSRLCALVQSCLQGPLAEEYALTRMFRAGRMMQREKGRGDFWLWAAIDGIRNCFSRIASASGIGPPARRLLGTCGLASKGQSRSQPINCLHTRAISDEGYSYGTETKIFGEPMLPDGTLARLGQNEGVRKVQSAERKAVVGSPDLERLTTSHIERAFLTVRQELKRFQRKGLGYSKDLETHTQATALFLGVYNFVHKHKTLGTTPAVAAGVEFEAWDLERVVEMTGEVLPSRRGCEV